jgi:uncharacterized OB-fold protein
MRGLLAALLLLAAPAAANPLASLDRAVDKTPRQGAVVEVVPAGPYRYALVDFDGTERWVVSLRQSFDAGDRVRVVPSGLARDFESARTGMVFDELLFAAVKRVD